jgi:hypothetical protein
MIDGARRQCEEAESGSWDVDVVLGLERVLVLTSKETDELQRRETKHKEKCNQWEERHRNANGNMARQSMTSEETYRMSRDATLQLSLVGRLVNISEKRLQQTFRDGGEDERWEGADAHEMVDQVEVDTDEELHRAVGGRRDDGRRGRGRS